MKTLFVGIVLIILIGIGGLVYRNAVEHPSQQIACPMDAKLCPDGSSVARTGLSCTFLECPPPNVTIPAANMSFAVPEGFSAAEVPDDTSLAAYAEQGTASTSASIIIRQYAVDASSTPLSVIQQTAISGTSGAPVSATSYSSSALGQYRFTVVLIERFEGVVHTAYYLAHGTSVLRFDAIDSGVANWTDSNLDVSTLPAHTALTKLLTTLQVL